MLSGAADAVTLRQQEARLAAETFNLTEASEVGLEIEARSVGASWANRGAEAVALLIEVDGAYNQDLMLWAGDAPFTYRVALGRLSQGKHVVSVKLNEARSATGARRAEVLQLKQLLLTSTEDKNLRREDLLALAYSPILYARANTIDRFTDAPLLMYYEIERAATEADEFIVRYTVIFSHEDGGTPTAALMARWGRASDIEWTYQIRVRGGRVIEETYQGVEHETKFFTGQRILGEHPLLAVASDNNNFSDLACSAVRYAPLPVRADLSKASRELVMDTHPWTYRIMAEELAREKRISDTPTNTYTTIADPRDYLYIEAYAEQTGTALSFNVATDTATELHRSDAGEARLRIDRSGYFRSAVRMPARLDPASISTITILCHANAQAVDQRTCKSVRLSRAFMLDQKFVPRLLSPPTQAPTTLTPGTTVVYKLRAPSR